MHPSYRVSTGLSEWGRDVLSRRVYAVLATLNRDGTAHTVPVGYGFDGERILIPSGSGSRKVRNLEADPRVRVLVECPTEAMGTDGWVAADGVAEVIRGDAAQELNVSALARYLTAAGEAVYAEALGPVMDLTIAVVPERWTAWDDSMMWAPLFEQGYTEREAAGWFLAPDS